MGRCLGASLSIHIAPIIYCLEVIINFVLLFSLPTSVVMRSVASVCMSMCLSIGATLTLTFKSFDLKTSLLMCRHNSECLGQGLVSRRLDQVHVHRSKNNQTSVTKCAH